MTVRTINHTRRVRIRRSDTEIWISDSAEGSVLSPALRLNSYSFPSEATVFVEAYRGAVWMRFRLGTVKAPRPDGPLLLSSFDSVDDVLFRVKVVEEQGRRGLLLGEADQIRPRKADEAEAPRISLLPVVGSPTLGDEVYKVEFDGERTRLLVNSLAGDWRMIAKSDFFYSLVYPDALRQILTRAVLIDATEYDLEADDWRAKWLSYASTLPGSGPPPAFDDSTVEDRSEWIETAVSCFSRHFAMLERFQGFWSREAGQG